MSILFPLFQKVHCLFWILPPIFGGKNAAKFINILETAHQWQNRWAYQIAVGFLWHRSWPNSQAPEQTALGKLCTVNDLIENNSLANPHKDCKNQNNASTGKCPVSTIFF